jgi:hypothetical protein
VKNNETRAAAPQDFPSVGARAVFSSKEFTPPHGSECEVIEVIPGPCPFPFKIRYVREMWVARDELTPLPVASAERSDGTQDNPSL